MGRPTASSRRASRGSRFSRSGRTPIFKPSTDRVQTRSMTSRSTPSEHHVIATTFGVELEFVLAFHQDQLNRVLRDYHIEANISKTLIGREHNSILGKDLPGNDENNCVQVRDLYPSWVLEIPDSDPAFQNIPMPYLISTGRSSQGSSSRIRRYCMEPLLIARDAMVQQSLQCNVIGWVGKLGSGPAKVSFPNAGDDILLRNEVVDYTLWNLTNDDTLLGPLRSQLSDRLRQTGVSEENLQDWDSHGVELISPVFRLDAKDQAFQQIENCLAALKGKLQYNILESFWAGMHVHIGLNFDSQRDSPTLLLQHVAYILMLHEELISSCHPKSRSGANPEPGTPPPAEPVFDDDDFDNFDLNAPSPPREPSPTPEELEAVNDSKVLRREARYTGLRNVESNLRFLTGKLGFQGPMTWIEIRNAIFRKDLTTQGLITHLQAPLTNYYGDQPFRLRAHIVNFGGILNFIINDTSWKPIKATIEFRQHPCTISIDEVRHWVNFIEAIIKAAEARSQQPPVYDDDFTVTEGNKYPHGFGTQWPCPDIATLCGFLGLDQSEVKYWQTRYNTFHNRP